MSVTHDERRRSPRIPVEMYVEFKHLGRPKESYAELVRNLSEGGVFLETSVGLELGTELELEIAPGPNVKPIRMRAEVVRVEEEPGSTGSKIATRTRGMALKFLDCDPADVQRLLTIANAMTMKGVDGNPIRARRNR